MSVFQGPFRIVYLSVKTVALYAGVFMLCYFWPLFLNALVAPNVAMQTEIAAGALISPLGFLVLGGLGGRWLFVTHFVLVALAALAIYAIWPREAQMNPEALARLIILPAVGAMYIAGLVFGLIQQLRIYQPEAPSS
jgi:hypothetical protein